MSMKSKRVNTNTKAAKGEKKSIPPRKLKPLNNLGDILRTVPSLSKLISYIDKKNEARARRAKSSSNKSNTTQDKLSNGHNRYGKAEADQ